jgi:hypothetical protein
LVVVICFRLAMSEEQLLGQLRARLMSLRRQRNRIVHRASDLERRASADLQEARRELDRARAELAASQASAAGLRSELDAFERDLAVRRLGNADRDAEWQSKWKATDTRWRRVQEARGTLEAKVTDAEQRLHRALGEQEAASAESARALAEVEHEIEQLMRDVGRLQAERPLPEAPDPLFREQLLQRIQHLDSERTWISEEIAVREERLRRIAVESNHIRSLLDLHTPEWGRDALSSLAPDPGAERAGPAWRQAVVEILQRASEPMHYREIADQLTSVGRGLGGQDPAETLLAALGRDPDFERVGRGTYWLKGRPLPTSWNAKGNVVN